MAKFCTRCGKPLDECTYNRNEITNFLGVNTGVLTAMKNRMGIGEPETNAAPNYERGMKIIPDCVKASEGEIPVKQYTVAELKNRLLGITFAKAEGRIEVTNKRVIFRALGRCISGRMTLQHEFSIDEIAGVEVRREFVTTVWDYIVALIVASIGGSISMAITSNIENLVFKIIVALILCIAAIIPFFLLKKKWMLKLLCTGFSLGAVAGACINEYGSMEEDAILFVALPGLIVFVLVWINIFLYAIKPNLVLIVKTKSASDAIDIQRKKTGILGLMFSSQGAEHTGYTEVMPMDNAEAAIRELGAIISDIQKFGDFGIEKWQEECFKDNVFKQ